MVGIRSEAMAGVWLKPLYDGSRPFINSARDRAA
jgi:hypothetical protein